MPELEVNEIRVIPALEQPRIALDSPAFVLSKRRINEVIVRAETTVSEESTEEGNIFLVEANAEEAQTFVRVPGESALELGEVADDAQVQQIEEPLIAIFFKA